MTTRCGMSSAEEIRVNCPVCGRRLCNIRGDLGRVEIQIKCPRCAAVFWITASYLKKILDATGETM